MINLQILLKFFLERNYKDKEMGWTSKADFDKYYCSLCFMATIQYQHRKPYHFCE